MRDLARSMIRFSWAMSVLGARQAANMLAPGEGWERSTESLDAVSHAAADQMGETMKGLYEAGDRFQSGMVDTVSRVFRGDVSSASKTLNDSWEAVDRTWSGMKDNLQSASSDEEV